MKDPEIIKSIGAGPFNSSDVMLMLTLAREDCATIASMFTVREGARIHPDIAWDEMNKASQIAAHTTAQQIAEEIRDSIG